ncbi:MAG: glycosyltransferase [Ignavibacteriae bacterium]|nr:glycosyltransferase [Ignavibacteriota bacterium]
MKISIITPTLNQASFIKDTIESVINQNHSDVEHIIVDGGSTDGTLEILNQYSHLNWISEKDSGAANAINKGMKIASGEIIAWINSDDFYEKNIFGEIEEHFRTSKVGFLYGNLTFVNKKKEIIRKEKTTRYNQDFLIHISADLIRQPCTFFRKELFEKTGGLNEELKYVFDYDLILKMLKISEPVYIDKNLAYYRDYEETLTRRYLKYQGAEIIKIARENGARIFDRIILSNFIKKVLFSKVFY